MPEAYALLIEGAVDYRREPPGAIRLGLAGIAFILTICTILAPLHVYTKRLCRPTLTKVVASQLRWVAWAQKCTNPFLDVFVYLSAITVTVEFYISFLPILVWCGLEEIVYSLVTLLALVSWVALAVKDILESPRPADAPQPLKSAVQIKVRDSSGDIEDGAPSLHCSASVPMVLHSLRLAVRANLLPPDSATFIEVLSLMWVLWVAWGRLYLGVHTPLDLISGTVLGFAVLELWQLSEAAFFKLLLHDPRFPLHLLLFAFLLMRCYPMPSRYTDCYQSAGAWGGAWCGAMLALWQHGYQPPPPATAAAAAPSSSQYPASSSPMAHASLRAAAAAVTAAGLPPPPPPSAAAVGPVQSSSLGVMMSSSSGSSYLPGSAPGPLLAAKIMAGLGMVVLVKIFSTQLLRVVFRKLFAFVPLPVRCAWQPPIAAPLLPSAAAQAAAAAGSGSGSHHKSSPGGAPAAASGGVQGSRAAPVRPAGVPGGRVSTGIGSSSRRLRCRADGTPWDVHTCARFCGYALTVNAVFQLNYWWPQFLAYVAKTGMFS
jgi:membrane-associated phospholipid phosphatase